MLKFRLGIGACLLHVHIKEKSLVNIYNAIIDVKCRLINNSWR